MPEDKINTMQNNMTKLNSNVEHMQKDIRKINDKLDEMCKKMENGFVRKDIYEVETEHIKEQIAFCKGVIFSGGGLLALYVINSIFEII